LEVHAACTFTWLNYRFRFSQEDHLKPLICTLTCLVVYVQTVDARPQQYQLPTRSEAVGLEKAAASGTLNVTLPEAVRFALENNPSLKIEKIRVEQARSRIEGQVGDYSPVFNSTSSVSRKDNIVASRFYPTGLYNEFQKSHNMTLEKRTYFGTKLTVGLNYADLRSTSNTQTLSPQYSANLTVGFSQPLLRDFGRSIGETRSPRAPCHERNLRTSKTRCCA